MLPGFRLLAIIVALSASTLVFGLGTAAVLRATHEEFATAPLKSMQVPPSNFVAETPTLALLQVEPPADHEALPAPPPPMEAPPAQETKATEPEDESLLPLVIISDPPSPPLTDAVVELPPQSEAAPEIIPIPESRPHTLKQKATVRHRPRVRHRAHRHYRRIVRPRPAPPPPPQPSFFPLFDPPSATTASTVATTATFPPR
ncbi:hypothetical protein OCA5_c10440 [Afipia carboxidovorans OM5]|uniref:Uncharacterized protein n=1 Tax=Afipia carboxidovorans (strain ATCC 49405 / DSM 1227 / KCTC 32145 / OM5) TaxID=504832 RepID=F8BSX2_AFIC5|nr:hypothetical protein [Afipia carboxidovorans]AEI02187.1 hypothetical protein OCA4_c10440 [Afipia carboxidovorans OM4]AEI05763.1 hypothetical protein OCA5_c10440 [Afipia carboxidovorans OM5]